MRNTYQSAYIVASVRTAVGKAPRGMLRHMRPDDMGAVVVRGAMERLPGLSLDHIEDVIMGCAMPEAEQGYNLGRVIAHRAGLPSSVPGMTVNRLCSSGLQTIAMAHQAVSLGQADVMVAGGVESMSLIPMGGDRWSPNPGMMAEMPQVYTSMGLTAENVAEQFDISRVDQDTFALRSHHNALNAIKNGHFTDEIIPLTVTDTVYKDGDTQTHETRFQIDEGPRADTSLEALAALPPVFRRGGSVTAGNSSQMSDGAAATILMGEAMVRELNLTPMARLLGFAVAGVPPQIMGIGPVEAVPKVLKQVGLSLDDIGLIELNEAFAAQSLAVMRKLGFNQDIVNVNGGAIALGHPLGCSGAKLTATLLHEMKRRRIRYGMVTMCVGGGMGAAGVFENLLL
ncbi:acetyl-CoA C-acyltransferase [Leptothoe spongobia]|uniref:acetyl-CoA C-acyltransferase n=1 Tax=Leptothoe spongobia TAU-MAC 1115 TaxID=1967444 RepID=A0A947DGN5_9CYAN|nr:acetyl-CoA C-acyltransferase [Leptothoe spongobia]MBT9316718.1 acetyl-CoA C-acyltransferase [Leptothoe spongobia TAU-MAC 1115]